MYAEEKFSSWLGTATARGRLGTSNLFTIYFDRAGKLWVGGADEGVFLYDPSEKKIHSIVYSPYDTSGISPGWILHIYQENDSIIWIGLNGAGINRYNIKSGKVLSRFINDPRDTTSLGHNAVLAIDKDSKGNLWFGHCTLMGGSCTEAKYLPHLQESIHNIVKHAHADRVCVSLVNERGEFNMVIKDDGCGFTRNGSNKGNGLRNMQRRAASVGGEFQIQIRRVQR